MPLNACVIRFWNKKKKRTDHIVLVTTDQELSASWIVRHYEERPEIEQDYEQMKSGGWQLKKLSSTRYSEIVFYVLTVVLSYSLYHLFANTQAGARFADKTRQAIAFEQLRTQRTHIIVYAGGYFEIFETLRFVQMVLQLPPTVQEQCTRGCQSISIKCRSENDLSATEYLTSIRPINGHGRWCPATTCRHVQYAPLPIFCPTNPLTTTPRTLPDPRSLAIVVVMRHLPYEDYLYPSERRRAKNDGARPKSACATNLVAKSSRSNEPL